MTPFFVQWRNVRVALSLSIAIAACSNADTVTPLATTAAALSPTARPHYCRGTRPVVPFSATPDLVTKARTPAAAKTKPVGKPQPFLPKVLSGTEAAAYTSYDTQAKALRAKETDPVKAKLQIAKLKHELLPPK